MWDKKEIQYFKGIHTKINIAFGQSCPCLHLTSWETEQKKGSYKNKIYSKIPKYSNTEKLL